MPSPEPRAPTPPSSSASLAAYRTPSCPAPSSTVFIASGLSTRAMVWRKCSSPSPSARRSARRSMTRYLAYVPADRLLIADAGADCPRYGPYQIQPGSMGPVHGSCWLCILVGCVFFLFSILCSPPYGSTYIILYPMSKYVPGLSQLSPNERKDVRGATPTGMVCGRVLGASSWVLLFLVLGSWVCMVLGCA